MSQANFRGPVKPPTPEKALFSRVVESGKNPPSPQWGWLKALQQDKRELEAEAHRGEREGAWQAWREADEDEEDHCMTYSHGDWRPEVARVLFGEAGCARRLLKTGWMRRRTFRGDIVRVHGRGSEWRGSSPDQTPGPG